MKKKLLSTLKTTLLFCLLFGIIGLGANYSDKQQAERIYGQARRLAAVPKESSPTMEVLEKSSCPVSVDANLPVLQEQNSEVIGWITIPETSLSYPLLQGCDNSFYLGHTWDKSDNMAGSIFLECKCPADLSGFNSIVYGHRMEDGSMFGSLQNYSSPDYLQRHPSIFITLDQGTLQYDIFAAFEAKVTDIVYGLNIAEIGMEEEFFAFSSENSVLDTNILPTPYDRILTLSTCTQNNTNTRWVVQAVLKADPSRTNA